MSLDSSGSAREMVVAVAAVAFDARWLARWLVAPTDALAALGAVLVGNERRYRGDAGVYQSPADHATSLLEGDETLATVRRAAAVRYARTQRALTANGLATLTVYRAAHGAQAQEIREALAYGATRVGISTRPLNSTSLDSAEADFFATHAGGGYRLRLRVDATRVFSDPGLDPRLRDVAEVIILMPEGRIEVGADDIVEVVGAPGADPVAHTFTNGLAINHASEAWLAINRRCKVLAVERRHESPSQDDFDDAMNEILAARGRSESGVG